MNSRIKAVNSQINSKLKKGIEILKSALVSLQISDQKNKISKKEELIEDISSIDNSLYSLQSFLNSDLQKFVNLFHVE